MSKAVQIFLLIVVFATAAYAGDVARDFTFETVDDKTINYRAAAGMPMVINIGSHWWYKCKDEAPDLQQAYLSYKDRGVGFIGVFVTSKDEDIKKFVETYKITYPVGKEKGIAEMLEARGIPTTVFISKNGKIVKRYIGPIKYAELVSNIEAMLK